MSKLKDKEIEITLSKEFPTFKVDELIIPGLYKTKSRLKVRKNIKNFKIKVNKAQKEGMMGVSFSKVGISCIMTLHRIDYGIIQMIMSKSVIKKHLDILELSKTWKDLLEACYKIATEQDND